MSKKDAIRNSVGNLLSKELKSSDEKNNNDLEVELINYDNSNNRERLNAELLSEDIKKLDKKNVECLILKSQRLFLFSKHKLYKELNYDNLEDFAENRHSISRRQLQKYVYIYEKLEKKLLSLFENGKSTSHFEDISIEKLYLISKIEEEEKVNMWFNKLLKENISVSEIREELSKDTNKDTNKEVKLICNYIKKRLPVSLSDGDKDEIKKLIKYLSDRVGDL